MSQKLKTTKGNSKYIRISIEVDGTEAGRAFLFMIKNDLHDKPYGLLEDVMVNEDFQKQGLGTVLVKKAIETAKEQGCYKLIATSRFSREHVHAWYEKLGFEKNGYDFRMNF